MSNQSVRAIEMLRMMALTFDLKSEYFSKSIELMIKMLKKGTAEEMVEAVYDLGTI